MSHDLPERSQLPDRGETRDEVLSELDRAADEHKPWRERLAWGTNYPASDSAEEVARLAYMKYFLTNAMAPRIFPSLQRFEREVIEMSASLLHGDSAVGTITSGGSESILLAVKSARDRASAVRPTPGVPEIVVPKSAHPAFWKAAEYFGLRIVPLDLDPEFKVRPETYEASITGNTVLLVASAPSFAIGMIDPVPEIGRLATDRNLSLHVDACIGGYFLPWVERLGVSLPPWDFRVPGVTTISLDLHKFGYAAKGASVVLSRDPEIYRHQVFRWDSPDGTKDWYTTSGMTGTRPGGAIAAAWAVMRHLGEEGYLELTARTLDYLRRWWDAIGEIDELEILGKPVMSVFAYTARSIDIYAVADGLVERGWLVSRSGWPVPAIKFMQSPGHEPYIDEYIADLRHVVEGVREQGLRSTSSASTYGS